MREILGARWSEVDLDAKVWTIPAERMKAAREHRVPLSEPALVILRKVNEAKVSNYVFPRQRADRPLSVMALNVASSHGVEDATVHGFRSAFRDCAGNETHFPREPPSTPLRMSSATRPSKPTGDPTRSPGGAS